MRPKLKSSLCTFQQLQSAQFRFWSMRMGEPFRIHRKLWEYCFIAQGLYERGMLQPGRRGLGFAVGREPLPSLFASYGCEIVATDLDAAQASQIGWTATGQHAACINILNERNLCPSQLFRKNVSFQVVDMNRIPDAIGQFDFIWSSCSFEHLGSIELGKRFIQNMTKCLKPRSVAIHTTEFNVSSNQETVSEGSFVIFRRQDIEDMATWLRDNEYQIDIDYSEGKFEADRIIDAPPYQPEPHLKLRLDKYVATSMGLIIESGMDNNQLLGKTG